MSGKKMKGLLSVREAKLMEEHYIKEFYKPLNDMKLSEYPGFKGAVRDIWFSIEELKEYIAYVENYAKEKNYSEPGLRVYFGAKDEKGQDGKIYPRQTVFFVPTAKKGGAADDEQFNLTGLERLNYGNAGIPDDRDSDQGMP